MKIKKNKKSERQSRELHKLERGVGEIEINKERKRKHEQKKAVRTDTWERRKKRKIKN